MSQKTFCELEKKWRSLDISLVFQITSISKIILSCAKTSVSHKDPLQYYSYKKAI